MSRVFLINVGANTAHQQNACCPIFGDSSFVYVSFPLNEGEEGTVPYSTDQWAFTSGLSWYQTHNDPDWENLTYGDALSNPRAVALKSAEPGDILLFWSLLWENDGENWNDFTGEKGWYLIGAIRIEEALWPGQSFRDALPKNRARAESNAHFWRGRLGEEHQDAVFVGDLKHSMLFDYAVPLITGPLRSSLLYKTFRTSKGNKLPLNGSHWCTFTRSCRAVWDLCKPEDRELVYEISDAIAKVNSFELLDGI